VAHQYYCPREGRGIASSGSAYRAAGEELLRLKDVKPDLQVAGRTSDGCAAAPKGGEKFFPRRSDYPAAANELDATEQDEYARWFAGMRFRGGSCETAEQSANLLFRPPFRFLMPTFNPMTISTARSIGHCAGYENWELILIDDGSMIPARALC